MPRLSSKAIERLRAGVRRAQEIPQGFDMNQWQTSVRIYDSIYENLHVQPPPCGTVGCLAFEVCAAANVVPVHFPDYDAANLLGLTAGDSGLRRLFFHTEWPADLYRAYVNAPLFSRERADVLALAVERWIAGDGNF